VSTVAGEVTNTFDGSVEVTDESKSKDANTFEVEGMLEVKRECAGMVKGKRESTDKSEINGEGRAKGAIEIRIEGESTTEVAAEFEIRGEV
jgi:hypothetical protein